MRSMKLKIIILVASWAILFSCSEPKQDRWCDHPIREEFKAFDEVQTRSTWFKVYRVGEGVFAIAEPYNFQEVISYLIVGQERNLLFDTGMGMDSISKVVRELSALPVIVINSHTHYDHIGGNHEFDSIYAVDTSYTHRSAQEGWSHEKVSQEVNENSFCIERLPSLDTASYFVKPYQDKIAQYINDGQTIDLGGRLIEFLQVPGHTPDGIALLDRTAGYLWTGDNYYEATIWLFFDGTDLAAYGKSVDKLAHLAPELKKVFPAHNTTSVSPSHLLDWQNAFQMIKSGQAKGYSNSRNSHPGDTAAMTFDFENFSFLIRKGDLEEIQVHKAH